MDILHEIVKSTTRPSLHATRGQLLQRSEDPILSVDWRLSRLFAAPQHIAADRRILPDMNGTVGSRRPRRCRSSFPSCG
jgi:hypothetical protein